MPSNRRHEGYLLIDNRSGPGVSADFIRSTGKDVPFAPEGGVFESATVTCSHCHAIVILNPDRTRARHYCQKCDHYVCDNPGCAVECVPMRQVIETLQNEAVHRLGL